MSFALGYIDGVGWNPFSEIFSTDIVLVSVYEIFKTPRSTLLLNTVFHFVTDKINVLKFIIVLFWFQYSLT